MTATGIREGLTYAEYDEIQAISLSKLSPIRKSPAHFKVADTEPRKATDALIFGQALHCLALEPDRFHERFFQAPDTVKTRRSQAYDSWCKERPGQTILLADEYENIFGMFEALVAHKTASDVLRDTKREVSLVWKCRFTNELCKGRLDAWSSELKTVIDLKTCGNAEVYGFKEDYQKYGYYRQAAWYQWGMESIGHPVDQYVLIAMEKEPPYGIKVYVLDQQDLKLSAIENEEMLRKYSTCKQLDIWPCYSTEIVDLSMSEWLRKDMEKKYGERIRQELNAEIERSIGEAG